jgi:thymidylate kinase
MGVLRALRTLIPWQPTAYIYIDTPPALCYDRVQVRARAGESALTENWLRDLAYDYSMMFGDSDVPVFFLDGQGSLESLACQFVDTVMSIAATHLSTGCTATDSSPPPLYTPTTTISS